jgi:hypothetical protein
MYLLNIFKTPLINIICIIIIIIIIKIYNQMLELLFEYDEA